MPPQAFEHVAIFNPPKNIDSRIAAGDCAALFWGDRERIVPVKARTWSYRGYVESWDDAQIIHDWEAGNLNVIRKCYVITGRLTEVLEARRDARDSGELKHFDVRCEDISAQLLSSSIAADHDLPKTKQGEQKCSEHKPSREGREASGIFRYQTFIFMCLAFGFIFMIAELGMLEEGRVISGAILTGFGFCLGVYSGLAAISGPVVKHF